jgi:hypothetical protein
MVENITNNILSLFESLNILFAYWKFFLLLVILQLAFGVLITWFFENSDKNSNILSVLCFLGGILGVTLLGTVMVVFKLKPEPVTGVVILVVIGLIFLSGRKALKRVILKFPIEVGVFFAFILLVRLIFAQGLIVPPYADSVTHIQIVEDILEPNQPSQSYFRLDLSLKHYYHFGFHAVAALLSGITDTEPSQAILFLGQYFQSLAVLSIFPLAYFLRRGSAQHAWIAMGVAGLFLNMPSHASNWGKFPAISSMIGITFVGALFLFMVYTRFHRLKRMVLLATLAIIATTFIHTRSIFTFGLLIGLFLIFTKSRGKIRILVEELNGEVNRSAESAVAASLILTLLFTNYIFLMLKLDMSILFSIVFFALLLAAFYWDILTTSAIILFTLTMGAGMLLPLGLDLLPERFSVIYDRPYLAIFSYVPISLISCFGVEGVLKLLSREKVNLRLRQAVVLVIIFGSVNTLLFQSHRASDCCIFIDDDNLFSFVWMKNNLPTDALVGIAAIRGAHGYTPADGGAWIEYFTHIPTRKIDSSLNFLGMKIKLCYDGITYYYLDDLENSFDEHNLIEAGGIHQFSLGDVRIYSLDCSFLE